MGGAKAQHASSNLIVEGAAVLFCSTQFGTCAVHMCVCACLCVFLFKLYNVTTFSLSLSHHSFTAFHPSSLSLSIYVVCISTYIVVFAVVIVVVLSVYLSVRAHENNTNDGFCSC